MKIPGIAAAKTRLKTWFLQKRKRSPSTSKWGPQIHRIAVALQLADESTFNSTNYRDDEIRYEFIIQFLHRFTKDKKMSSQELALYIHAMLVSCMDPKDFYGDNLVLELRKRVEATGNYTNPFQILVLCNAGDTMTIKDVERVTAAFDSQHRPFWTDLQALASMALACISSRAEGIVDERILKDMLQELKRHQFRNGTVDNFRTTALVTQAMFIHDSYKKEYDLNAAVQVLIDGLTGNYSLLDAYYTLPVFYAKSLLNVTANHCSKDPGTEEEALQKLLDTNGEAIIVKYSVWIGDKINLARTWGLRIPANSTIYAAIETVAKIDNRQNVKYSVVEGKPYVKAVNGIEDDPEMGTYWFIYLKSSNSDDQPNIVEESPADLKLLPNQEIILWYKPAPWIGPILN
ncbi:Cobalamin binding intrinsic factor like protein [Argiope bruennichi]|uniref:Cobalamin binding intrinsic factor like protein n=1 Tax=Argiope bruennichi TaxID=94029 RepID=A0A8T0ESK2_ARGBR|nr:Cobalamin binding intrinsic factor like protein [Argiope bruennichi]